MRAVAADRVDCLPRQPDRVPRAMWEGPSLGDDGPSSATRWGVGASAVRVTARWEQQPLAASSTKVSSRRSRAPTGSCEGTSAEPLLVALASTVPKVVPSGTDQPCVQTVCPA